MTVLLCENAKTIKLYNLNWWIAWYLIYILIKLIKKSTKGDFENYQCTTLTLANYIIYLIQCAARAE